MSTESAVRRLYRQHYRREPDLKNPRLFSERVQWLKIHDQHVCQIDWCDKILARDMAARLIGDQHIVPAGGWPAVVKASHNSGGGVIALTPDDMPRARQRIERQLSTVYGADKGEWAYQYIEPAMHVERLLPHATDYKWHCVDGEPRILQVIQGRATDGVECTYTPDGEYLGVHVNWKLRRSRFSLPYCGDEIAEMMPLVYALAAGWRYVRVDLYYSPLDDLLPQPWFGELTFWPLSGIIRTGDEHRLTELLPIDCTDPMEPWA